MKQNINIKEVLLKISEHIEKEEDKKKLLELQDKIDSNYQKIKELKEQKKELKNKLNQIDKKKNKEEFEKVLIEVRKLNEEINELKEENKKYKNELKELVETLPDELKKMYYSALKRIKDLKFKRKQFKGKPEKQDKGKKIIIDEKIIKDKNGKPIKKLIIKKEIDGNGNVIRKTVIEEEISKKPYKKYY